MNFQNNTILFFAISGLIAFFAFLLSLDDKKNNWAIKLLILSSFLLRFSMSIIDPFLHKWDEKFHALVAKNMIDFPFKPMLHAHPILEYNYTSWCCNHIWLHKQPLFLWQMAVSLKLFGISLWSLRLPSVLMGTVSIFFIYQIAEIWFKNKKIAFLSALLYTFFNYHLELISGRNGTAHNDLAFGFYILASFWAFTRFTISEKKIKWAVIIGIFVAGAILNKWLVGLLVYATWGFYILYSKSERFKWQSYAPMSISLLVSSLLFLPWQIYTHFKFPIESMWESQFNRKHIFEVVEHHEGDIFFHLTTLWGNIGSIGIIFLLVGIFFSFKKLKIETRFSSSILFGILILFSFFSFVATKMASFTYSSWSLLMIYIAAGVVFLFKYISFHISLLKKNILFNKIVYIGLASYLVFSLFKPYEIFENRIREEKSRDIKITNTQIYQKLNDDLYEKDRVILNLKPFNQIDLMFYQDVYAAYAYWPKKEIIDSLIDNGYKFSAFKNHHNQNLPSFIKNNPEIQIIDLIQK